MWCWMNGDLLRQEELKISPFDHGFLYGVGFFETFRTYNGQVLLFREHMKRLSAALLEYRITMPYSEAEIFQAVKKLTEKHGGEDGYFRLNVSAGNHEIGLAPSAYPTPNAILFRKDLPKVERGTEKTAVWLETRRNQPESSIRHKSHNFLNNVRGRMEVSSLRDTEGIFVTHSGHVAEGITSNVFWIKDETLYTPTIETGILPGTTRALICRLALANGIQVKEGFYSKEDVEAADELFVTNAVQEIVPISKLENTNFPGNTGEFYQNIHKAYIKAISELKEGTNEWN